MAEFQFSKLVYMLILTSATTEIVVGLEPYTEHSFAKICDPLGNTRRIFLLGHKNAAAIVKPNFAFDTWPRMCSFVFSVRKGEHLFAVIQNMNLRRNETHCIDYVKFKRKDKRPTRQFCGYIDRRTGNKRQEHLDWETETQIEYPHDFAEFDTEGEIETTIHLSSKKLRPDEKRLDLTIIYTPYKDCDKIKEDRNEYQEQRVTTTNYSICIWQGYVCDGYQNCVPDVCRDENVCGIVFSNGTGTKVTIGAVTTMLLCFIILIMGMWICRRHKKLCWSSDCSGPSAHDNRLARAEREAANSANPSVAVAPMLEVAVVPTVLDKDSPPSYDSLFPEQANPSTT